MADTSAASTAQSWLSLLPMLMNVYGASKAGSVGQLDPALQQTMNQILQYQYGQMQADSPLHQSIRQLAMYLLPTAMQHPITGATGTSGSTDPNANITNVLTPRDPNVVGGPASYPGQPGGQHAGAGGKGTLQV